GKDHKAMLKQHLNHGAMRRLDRHSDLSRRGFGLLCQPGSAVRELVLTHLSSFGIKQANAMALRRAQSTPTNHCTLSTMVGSPRSRRATAILIDPCTGALGAMTSYWISIAAAPSGRGSYAGAQAQVDKAAPGGSARATNLHRQTWPPNDLKGTGWVERKRNPPLLFPRRQKAVGYAFG